MKIKDKFNECLIPYEHLKNIKGCENDYPAGIGISFCPVCGKTNLVATLNVPPTVRCWDCGASWIYKETDTEIIIDMEGGDKGDMIIKK